MKMWARNLSKMTAPKSVDLSLSNPQFRSRMVGHYILGSALFEFSLELLVLMNIFDITYKINFLYNGGPAPICTEEL